jgi:Bacterial PH domain/Short C-terminal domain
MSKVEKLTKEAQAALMEGERVLDATTGMVGVHRMGQDTHRNGAVIVTDRRVVLFSKKMAGYDLQDFAFGLLSSVEHKKGLTYGNLTFSAAGSQNDVRQVPKADVERIAQLIREKMATAHSGSQSVPTTQGGVADEIRKLSALRDEGLITADEYEAKKKQLLGL